jgi:hypothetical protein
MMWVCVLSGHGKYITAGFSFFHLPLLLIRSSTFTPRRSLLQFSWICCILTYTQLALRYATYFQTSLRTTRAYTPLHRHPTERFSLNPPIIHAQCRPTPSSNATTTWASSSHPASSSSSCSSEPACSSPWATPYTARLASGRMETGSSP